MEGSPFVKAIPSKSTIGAANNNGRYFKAGSNFILTKQSYLQEDFPYWKLIRISKSN
jgi:hypothetical protein